MASKSNQEELAEMGALNQKISPDELAKIRRLADFDIVMLLSECHDHGWPAAAKILAQMPERQ